MTQYWAILFLHNTIKELLRWEKYCQELVSKKSIVYNTFLRIEFRISRKIDLFQ